MQTRTLLLVFLGVVNLWGSPSFGQIPAPGHGLGAQPYSEENACHNGGICSAATEFDDLGIYDIEVYAGGSTAVDGIRFSLDFPDAWTVIDFETCGWSITKGDPYDPGAGLELIGDRCYSREGPLLRLTVSCLIPGQATMWGFSGNGMVQLRACEADWFDVFDYYEAPVNIGDFCGRINEGPCNYCPQELAGWASPSSVLVNVAPGEQVSREVRIYGHREANFFCGQIPECGGIPTERPCLNTIQSLVPWASTTYLRSDGHDHYYDVTFDATELEAGKYDGRVSILSGPCPFCEPSCFYLEMVVEEPSAVEDDSPQATKLAIGLRGNPTSTGEIAYTLTLPRDADVRVDLVDVHGRVLGQSSERGLSAGSHRRTLLPREPELDDGVYFLRVRTQHAETSCKVIVAGQ